MTPQDFANKYGSQSLDDFICLVHDPRPSSPTGRTFTVDYLGNVVGGDIVRYLNVDIETMKKAAMDTILYGEPVWMGCDVGKMMRRDLGIWDAKLFDYGGVYDTSFNMSKSERLFYHQTVMTHAMLFTGVDVVETPEGPRPRRWRVENSWGDEGGKKGFYVMNDNWFDEYMFEIATPKKYLPQQLVDAWEQEPIRLPPWESLLLLQQTSCAQPCLASLGPVAAGKFTGPQTKPVSAVAVDMQFPSYSRLLASEVEPGAIFSTDPIIPGMHQERGRRLLTDADLCCQLPTVQQVGWINQDGKIRSTVHLVVRIDRLVMTIFH